MKYGFYKKSFIAIICVLLLIVLGIFLKLFFIGEPVDGAQVHCTASVNNQSLELRVAAIESGVAIRGWKFEQEGGTMFISARKVLVSPLFDKEDYETIIDLEAIDNVVLGGQEIWTNKN